MACTTGNHDGAACDRLSINLTNRYGHFNRGRRPQSLQVPLRPRRSGLLRAPNEPAKTTVVRVRPRLTPVRRGEVYASLSDSRRHTDETSTVTSIGYVPQQLFDRNPPLTGPAERPSVRALYTTVPRKGIGRSGRRALRAMHLPGCSEGAGRPTYPAAGPRRLEFGAVSWVNRPVRCLYLDEPTVGPLASQLRATGLGLR